MTQPLQFRPIMKRAPWGGRNLNTLLGKPTGPGEDYAESWEISDHGEDQSVVAGGHYDGWTLSRLVAQNGSGLFGLEPGATQFPLLIKYLDARKTLSVQVHPNDTLAREYDPEENGKDEAWVIMAADPGARLYAGLRPGVDAGVLRTALETGSVADCLHSVKVKPGDCIFNPAGAVHAVGAGIVLAEIQQASDITFRLFDWNRPGLDGKPRPLHVEEALECIDFELGPLAPAVPKRLTADHDRVELVRCNYFVMQRHSSNTPFELGPADRFTVVMVLEGQADLECEGPGQRLALGQTVLMPRSEKPVTVIPDGAVTLLTAVVPPASPDSA